MKVYVLVTDSALDYEQETQVQVLQTKDQAQEVMWGDKECAQDNGDLDNLVLDYEGSMNICYCEEGNYTHNHLEWTIYEREVEPDPELENVDEKGSGGLWDKAAEITMAVVNTMQRKGFTRDYKLGLYADECGMELVYNILKEMQQ